jgi:putative hemolysin
LTVRLADSPADVRAAQALRYQVFCVENGRSHCRARSGLDVDPYDAIAITCSCSSIGRTGPRSWSEPTGCCCNPFAERHSGFYSGDEYDLAPLMRAGGSASSGQMLELGRSCVAPAYRNAGTIALLWRGIADYLDAHNVGLMFGCASFPGTDPAPHAAALSYLAHHHAAPAELKVRAQPDHYVEMARLAPGSYDTRLAARSLPPLIKGYLRVGAIVGDGAFLDHDFNTVDIFVLMPVEQIAQRYSERFRKAA